MLIRWRCCSHEGETLRERVGVDRRVGETGAAGDCVKLGGGEGGIDAGAGVVANEARLAEGQEVDRGGGEGCAPEIVDDQGATRHAVHLREGGHDVIIAEMMEEEAGVDEIEGGRGEEGVKTEGVGLDQGDGGFAGDVLAGEVEGGGVKVDGSDGEVEASGAGPAEEGEGDVG